MHWLGATRSTIGDSPIHVLDTLERAGVHLIQILGSFPADGDPERSNLVGPKSSSPAPHPSVVGRRLLTISIAHVEWHERRTRCL